MWPRFFQILNVVMLCLFVAAVALQYNDPDPYLWMPIYGLGALWSAMLLLKKELPRLAIRLFSGLCLLGVAYLAITVLIQEEPAAVEQFSELGGLLITSAWGMLVLAMSRQRDSSL